jgi:hypothetical protein
MILMQRYSVYSKIKRINARFLRMEIIIKGDIYTLLILENISIFV